MSIDKHYVFDTLAPLLPRIPVWFLAALHDWQTKVSATDKIRKGPQTRARWIHSEIISQMRTDPVVSGIFRPVDDEQLEFIQVDADQPICLLFKKADIWKERVRTANQPSYRQEQRREGELLINGAVSTPIVCHYLLHRPDNPVSPQFDSIAIGEETHSGFTWRQSLWTRAGGLASDIGELQDNFSLMPVPVIRPIKTAKENREHGA